MLLLKRELIFIMLIVITVAIVLLCSLYYFQIAKENNEDLINNVFADLRQMEHTTMQSLNDINNILKPVTVNYEVQNILKGQNPNVETRIILRSYLSQMLETNYLFYDIKILDLELNEIAGIQPFANESRVQEQLQTMFKEGLGKNKWMGPVTNIFNNADYDSYYWVNIMQIHNAINYDDIIGYLCVIISEDNLRNNWTTMFDDTSSLGIMNSDGKIISSNVKLILGKTAGESIDGWNEHISQNENTWWKINKNLIAIYRPLNSEYFYFKIHKVDNLGSEGLLIIGNILIVAGVGIGVSMIIGTLLMTRSLRPFERLKASMKKLESGNFEEQVEVKAKGEIVDLIKVYNEMVHRIRGLMEDMRQLEREKVMCELYALHAQINPHFIYNTLATIRWLAQKNGDSELVRLIQSFAEVLRSGITIGRQFVTLREEINCLKSFAHIQQVRFDNKFIVRFEVDEDMLDCCVLKFSLQVLLENSIIHGFENIDQGGVIDVTCKTVEDKHYFCVEDNGTGFGEKGLIDLQEKLKHVSLNNLKDCIGLMNLKKRLHIYYGQDYDMFLENKPKGAKVYMYLPVKNGVNFNENFDS